MSDHADPKNSDSPLHGRGIAIALIALCVFIELVLQAGDRGAFNIPRFRQMVYENGGFWSGLLDDWTPNYPGQPWAMFATYGFLHSGFVHLGVNMLTLWSLAGVVIDRVGQVKFSVLYVGAILGGAIGFGLLAETLRPMVGASGALFGLAGAILSWEYVDRFTWRDQLWPVVRAVLMLIALNIVLYWAMGGQLAWETHLGGFVAGWLLAMLIDPRSRALED